MIATEPDLFRLSAVLDRLLDDRVGIVGHLELVPREPGDPEFFQYAARACNTAAFSRERNFGNTGGASWNRNLAAAKAIGEAVERYCGAIFDVEEFSLRSFEEAEFLCVHPREFALYSSEQYDEPGFPWVPFEESTPVRWVPATDPLNGETVNVPAAMVYVPYFYYQGSGEAPIVQPISTGLSCGMSLAEAAIGAICEVIERDAVTITWQGSLSPPGLRIESLSNRNRDLVRRFERTGDRVTLLNITLDCAVPTCLALLHGGFPNRPGLVIAGATDPKPEDAVRKSLEELEHTRRYSQQIMSSLPRMISEPGHSNVRDQVTHLNFWCDHQNAPHAAFLAAAEKTVDFADLPTASTGRPHNDLADIAERVRAAGHRVLLVDLTTPDVKELGMAVVRAIIPGFHPLFMGFRTRALGGTRLWDIPRRLGYQGRPHGPAGNLFPHPYP